MSRGETLTLSRIKGSVSVSLSVSLSHFPRSHSLFHALTCVCICSVQFVRPWSSSQRAPPFICRGLYERVLRQKHTVSLSQWPLTSCYFTFNKFQFTDIFSKKSAVKSTDITVVLAIVFGRLKIGFLNPQLHSKATLFFLQEKKTSVQVSLWSRQTACMCCI